MDVLMPTPPSCLSPFGLPTQNTVYPEDTSEEFYVPTINVELNSIFQIFVVVCFTSALNKPPLAAGILDGLVPEGWTLTKQIIKKAGCYVNEKWERSVTISGHFGSVQSITWAPGKATYLLSASRDYTTRLHAPWKRNGKVTWHEIARPQVHGYEMQFIVSLSDKQFASAGDEKVIRIFEAPQSFHNSYLKISGKNIDDEKQSKAVFANVPALGLSNKAFYPGPDETEQEPVVAESDVASKQPPMEDEIIQSTLWPETRKLYGHGFEVFCLTTHPSGKLLASACKASKHEYAVIRIWDCGSWKQLQTLVAHSLTVTQMAYSNSGDRLLAVSRDRTWSVWRQSETKEKGFVLEQHADKKTVLHTRIIWTCSWSPDDKYFVTGSRDRKIIVWKNGEGAVTQQWSLASDVFVANNAVTAIDFCSQQIDELNGVYLLAVGLESGQLSLFSWQCKQKYQLSWNKLLDFNSSLSHSACVKQVQWHKEMTHFNSSKHLMLATCGEDYAVKIIDIAIQQD
ncbi:elongator complex protein 2-like [Corticium candelabrum]|uniref:elongator complex protein 2-like n=1 Tax=Corticium candelabrum TaxID=121492 RepID=UPI002E263998|nr:elongator complex protein 2-like [Corticium candelabrum]